MTLSRRLVSFYWALLLVLLQVLFVVPDVSDVLVVAVLVVAVLVVAVLVVVLVVVVLVVVVVVVVATVAEVILLVVVVARLLRYFDEEERLEVVAA